MASYTGRGVHGQVVHKLGARIVGGEIAEGEILTSARSERNWM